MTFNDDGQWNAQFVVQGFTDQRLGKIPTSSPTASRRSRQFFLTFASSLGFSNSQRRRAVCVSSRGDLDEQHEDDNDDDALQNRVSTTSFRQVL